MLFTTREMLRRKVIKPSTDEALRMELGENLKRYLDHVVCWDVVVRQYNEAYKLAPKAVQTGQPVVLEMEF